MDFSEWETWYDEILNDFNFSREDDEESADILNEILDEEFKVDIETLKEKSNREKFIVFGAGPSLKDHIKLLKNHLDEYVLIAADGATTALLEERIVPNIIATDLDGNLDSLLAANDRGSGMVIHAHGNNMEAIKNYTPFFNFILGTTQSKPHDNLYNFGGFTDGDRAIFLAVELGAKEIVLAGMDFGDIVTRYSRPNIKGQTAKADEIKLKKLQYAERLTNWISENENVKIINLKDI